jgi:MFS family permease
MLPRTDSGEAGALDVVGLLLLPGSAAATTYALSEVGSGASFGSPQVVIALIAGAALGLAFSLHALRIERPLLDIRLYANRVFAGASFTTFGLAAALFGAMILVPLYYQQVRGESVIDTGLLNAPQGIGALVAMPIAGRLTDRFGGGRIALSGVSLLALSTIPLTFFSAHTSTVLISLVLVVRGVSIGFSFMPAMAAAFAAMRPEQLSDATPQLNVLMRLGGAIGTTVLAVVLQRAAGPAPSIAHLARAFDAAYWWALGIALLSLIPCVMLLRAESPRERRREAERQAPAEALGLET